MEAAIAYDATKFINASIEEVQKTLLEAALIVIVVIFLFLGNLRSTLIPIVTIPLSLIGVMFALLALGYSINLLTLLALVLAIGLVVDDAIVVVENIHRHIEEGMQPFDAALTGAREIAVPVISMTITLAAVYAPIGFVSGLTGALFREFAFTLAGAVVVSGVIALTLSPMMASKLLKAQHSTRPLQPLPRPHLRPPAAALRAPPPPHAQLPAGDAADPRRRHGRDRHHVHRRRRRSWRPRRTRASCSTSSRAPQTANLDYLEQATSELNKVFETVPEKEHVFIINGLGNNVHQAIAGILFKPWEERTRTQKQILQSLQPKVAGIAGAQAISFAAALAAGLDRRPAGAVRASRPRPTIPSWRRCWPRCRRRQPRAASSSSPTRDLKFETPQVELKIDHDKANRLGITMQDIGGSLATLLGGNYVNRFNLYGRSYQVIPQVPRDFRLTAGLARALPGAHGDRRAGAAVEHRHGRAGPCSPMR